MRAAHDIEKHKRLRPLAFAPVILLAFMGCKVIAQDPNRATSLPFRVPTLLLDEVKVCFRVIFGTPQREVLPLSPLGVSARHRLRQFLHRVIDLARNNTHNGLDCVTLSLRS